MKKLTLAVLAFVSLVLVVYFGAQVVTKNAGDTASNKAIYRNKNFTFSYPNNLVVEERKAANPKPGESGEYLVISSKPGQEPKIFVYTADSSIQPSLKKYIEITKKYDTSKATIININGMEGYKLSVEEPSFQNVKADLVFLESDGHYFEIVHLKPPVDDIGDSTFNELLKSFIAN